EARKRRQARQQQRTEDETAAEDGDGRGNGNAALILFLVESADVFVLEDCLGRGGRRLVAFAALDRLDQQIKRGHGERRADEIEQRRCPHGGAVRPDRSEKRARGDQDV